MDSTKTKEVLDLTRLGLFTFLNIGQMTRYRVDYLVRNQNRDKMMKHASLVGLGIISLFAIGILGLNCQKRTYL